MNYPNKHNTILKPLFGLMLFCFLTGCVSTLAPIHPAIDADMTQRGNDIYLHQANLDIRYYHYAVGDEHFRVGIYQKLPLNHIRYLVIHDDENAAYDSAIRAIAHGGRVVVLENNEKRGLYDARHNKYLNIDPNRIFKGNHPYLPLAMHLLHALELQDGNILIALHNNSPYSRFGMESITNATNVHTLCQHDPEPKNLYWLATAHDINTAKNQYQYLCQHPINAVFEQAPSIAEGDGSLSIYTANKSIGYVNIEIKAGNKDNQDSETYAKDMQLTYIDYFLSSHNQ